MSLIHGHVSDIHCARWTLPHFLDLPPDRVLESPRFHFADSTWCLRMNGGIYLIRLASLASRSRIPQRIVFEVGIVGRRGKVGKFSEEFCFHPDCEGCLASMTSRSYIRERRSELVPGGTLTLYCEMRQKGTSGGGAVGTELGGDSSVVSGRSSRGAGVGEQKLGSDYKKLLEGGEASDLCLVVSGREFRAHRCILGARSPVFGAMFGRDAEEGESGRVLIEDLDPDCFELFLEHVYTGRVEALSDENAFGLYSAADKYEVQDLKSDCLEHIKRTLSVDSCFDAMYLATRHHDAGLMDLAVEFYKKNSAAISLTEKYRTFLRDFRIANDLKRKAIVTGDNEQ